MPFIIPVPGNNLPGVLTYRDLDDVQAMMLAAKSRGHAVVIGGGLLGLAVNRGIVVDARMQTSDPDILALGECAEVGGLTYGLIAPLYQMANVAARHLAGEIGPVFSDQAMATRLKVTGVDLYSAGDFAGGDDREEIMLRDASAGVYKRLVLKDDRIIGAVLYGEAADGPCSSTRSATAPTFPPCAKP